MERGMIVNQCEGCNKITVQGNECIAYIIPEAKWRNGATCPLATHVAQKVIELKMRDPLKESKSKFKIKK
jgi:hypothetical protein